MREQRLAQVKLNRSISVGDLQAVFHGKVELFQDDTFLANSRGQTQLLASVGTAVIVVHHKDHCWFQTVLL